MTTRLLSAALLALAACTPQVVFDAGAGGGADGGAGGDASTSTDAANGTTTGSGSTGSGSTGSGTSGSGTSGSGTSGSVTSGAGGANPTGGSSGTSTVTTTGPGAGGGFPTSSSVTTGGFCKSCSDALYGVPGQLCPQSEVLFFDFVECACQTGCANECAPACDGGPAPPNCDTCIDTVCAAPLDACLEDS